MQNRISYDPDMLPCVNRWILRFFDISVSGPMFVPTAQVLLSEDRGICLNGKTHILAQFNAMENFSIPEFGNAKWKSESMHVALLNQSSVLNIESYKASSHHVGN